MPNPPPPAAAERFAALLQQLSLAVAHRTGWALTHKIIALIITRIRGIKRRFADLAARVAAGTYRPRRRPAAPRARPGQLPPANPLPNRFGWLRPMIAETPAFAGQFDSLLRDPEIAALVAAAPAAVRRPLRSLCWMLGVAPPPVLALPPRAGRPRPSPPDPSPPDLSPPDLSPPDLSPPAPPAAPAAEAGWPHDPRRRTRLGFYKGPPPPPSAARHGGPGRRTSG